MAHCKVQIRYDKYHDYKRSTYWYPKKIKRSIYCLFCNGRGEVKDLKTGNPRICVGCGGRGIAQNKAA